MRSGLTIPAHRMRSLINVVMIAGALALGRQVATGSPMLRISAAVGLMVMLGVPAIERPKTAMLALFAWLPFLGFVRRALIPSAGWSSLDPLLLVSTAVSLVVLITLMVSKRAELGGTGLAKIVFAYLVIVLIQLFNPHQGSVLVALTGVMFIVVPLTVFFIARTIADESYTRKVQNIIIATAFLTALWGLKQVYIGFTGFERQWLDCCAYGALKINQTIRPFSTFTNSLEFAGYMGFGVVVCVARLLYSRGYTRILLAGMGALIAYAGFLVGSRGVVVGTVVALVVLVGLRAKSRMASIAIITALVGAVVGWSATHTAEPRRDVEQGAEQLRQQQAQALTDPFNAQVSSLPSHINDIREGLVYSFHHPEGLGTGSITRGGSKFRQGTQTGTELDVGNAFLAFGVIGGFVYLLVIARTFFQLYALRRRTLSPMWAAVLGMCIIAIGQWQNSGAYALTSMIWFMIGASDRGFMELPSRARFSHPNVSLETAA